MVTNQKRLCVNQIHCLFLPLRSPLYSVEVMDEAMEPFSQSLSMFLLDALLSIGNDSMEHTDPALKDKRLGRSDESSDMQNWEEINKITYWEVGILTSETLPLQR